MSTALFSRKSSSKASRIIVVIITIFLFSAWTVNVVDAFAPFYCNNLNQIHRKSSIIMKATVVQEPQQGQEEERTIVDRSTLVLLEHVNLNVPSQEKILPFYWNVLGCGMDPRKVSNLDPMAAKKTLWANAGATQFHLPYGDVAQRIPGQIGLRYDDDDSLLDGLKERMEKYPDAYQSSEILENGACIRLVDHYDNVFYCRAGGSRVCSDWKQPILVRGTGSQDDDGDGDDDDTSTPTWRRDAMAKYGRDNDTSDCRGIDYVEFHCPVGTAAKIALFYESVFDATTFCVPQQQEDNDDNNNNHEVAIIALGKIDSTGRADQTLLFRETTEPIPKYDGHHIAMYVGTCAADFEQAFKNAEMANVVWVNPRFSDKAHTLQGAKQWKQFRFKDIVDMKTGKKVFELEHEMRSVEHEAWPGPKPMTPDY